MAFFLVFLGKGTGGKVKKDAKRTEVLKDLGKLRLSQPDIPVHSNLDLIHSDSESQEDEVHRMRVGSAAIATSAKF